MFAISFSKNSATTSGGNKSRSTF
ncbi:MAG: hypothetical protein K2X47_10905 [Bdellovibrionales bacterium]|nr:hypothetical protein [Bdellovibrionales bacterium]